MGSAGKISVFNRKKKRAAQQARRAADGRLREAMKCSGYEDLRSAITFAEREVRLA